MEREIMMIYKTVTNLLIVLLLLLAYTTPAACQDIVRVDSENAKIHMNPQSTDSQVIPAQKDDLFELAAIKNGWVGIQMFSGEVRYLKSNDVEIVSDFHSEQVNYSKIIELCQDVQHIENQAIAEADSKYPDDNERAEAYINAIIDNEVLTLFRTNNIPATHNTIFLDCINDSLMPYVDG